MRPPLAGAELARPFLPATDFEQSKRFYLALGFELLLDSEVAIFGVGAGGFILQRYQEPTFAAHYMMQLMVDDLEAWWGHLVSLDLPGRFGITMLRAPAMQPWGLRVAYVADPCGVLWHIAERRPGVAHDQGGGG